tara:strand:+ start:1436 stop:1765 length:330 start_codon:yes stop_codon:yes gene_type:complete
MDHESTEEEFDERRMKLTDLEMAISKSQSQVRDNLNLVIERGDKLEDLEDKSLQLSKTSNTFYKTSRQVRRRMWWKKVKMNLIIFLIFCLFLWFVLSLACGFDFHQCRS